MESTQLGLRQRQWFAALDHARLTGAKPTYNVAGDYYKVRSPGSGRLYIVRRYLVGGSTDWTCSCPAAYAGNVCWHRALVMALPHERIERAMALVGLGRGYSGKDV